MRALAIAVTEFGGYTSPDKSWATLLAITAPQLDPGVAGHRRALLTWLNAWGCRIRYPRPGEADVFDEGVAGWWSRWHTALPAVDATLTALSDDEIDTIGECYGDLAAVRVAPTARRLGSTAASKLLYALRPTALLPWDEAIANGLHGRRDADAYASHQRLTRGWARQLLAEAEMDEGELAAALGCPGRPLTKMLDDYCYIVFTRNAGQST